MKWIKTTFKLALAGLTILAIAMAMLTFGPDQTVKSAEADILSFDFAPKTNTQKFQDSLSELGMDKPRKYDWNGNKMYFSTMVTDDEPLEVLYKFQKKFYDKGLNKEIYSGRSKAVDARGRHASELTPAEQKQSVEHMGDLYTKHGNFFTGGIVPHVVDRDYVSMSGMDSKSGAKQPMEFLKEVMDRKSPRLSDSVGAARVVEAFRESGRTRVTATWTDDEVDFSKFRNASTSGETGGSATVPACMGCERMMRFEGESEKGYVSHAFQSKTQTKLDVIKFYNRALTNRGWLVSPATIAMQEAEHQGMRTPSNAELLSFTRDKEFLTLLIYTDDEGRTITKVMESP